MAIKEFDITNYYETEEKTTSDDFLNILDDMNDFRKFNDYKSYCVTDALQGVYEADDCEIAFVTREYATPINNGPNSSLNEYNIFGLTMDGEDLLMACEQMRQHGNTPLDIVAGFALLAGKTTELDIAKEAMDLYEQKRNKMNARSKTRIFRQYGPQKRR